jgi:PHD/YefM family antitoxin component YafN of YafNO toxin-antitoxin module
MIDIHHQILEKDGKRQFVIISYEDFQKIQAELENYEDLRLLREAKLEEREAPTTSLKEAKKALGLE